MSANFWKFYCWIFAVVSIPLGLIELVNISKWRLVDYFYPFSVALGFLVIYSYAYKVKVFPQNVWKITWFCNIAWVVITIFYSTPPFDKYYPDFLKSYYYFEPIPNAQDLSFLLVGLVCIAAILPLYFANYVLAFDQEYLNSQNSKKKG